MEQLPIYMTFFVVTIAVLMYYTNKNNEIIYVKSPKTQIEYLVQNRPDKEKAAELIDSVGNKLDKFVDSLVEKYPEDDRCQRLRSGFDPKKITEAAADGKYTSYTINKGEKMILCVRSRDDKEELIDNNTLTFVTLHELSHIMSKSIGHEDQEFWNNFKFLLDEAVKSNIYKKVDYSKNPKPYCGIKITDSPLYN